MSPAAVSDLALEIHAKSVCKDASLAETKDAVRQKLDLPAGEDIKLSRIESGVHIDLDDGKTRCSSRKSMSYMSCRR